MQSGEIVFTGMERVAFGTPAAEAVAAEASRRGATRVFLLVSRTLNSQTDEVDRLRSALGNRYAGTHDDMPSHSPREAVVACANAARAAGCDLLFAPAVDTLYPLGLDLRAWVDVERGAAQLEGAHRPGHFRGVATVVTKLLNLVLPDIALFGEKDYEQLLVVRLLVRELLLPVEIAAVPTVREADGLALSSRNAHLDAAEREQAPALYRTLQWAAAKVAGDTARAGSVEVQAKARLAQAGFRVDYFRFCNAELAPASDPEQEWRVLAAAWLGATRLIDNLGFRPADGPPAWGTAGQG